MSKFPNLDWDILREDCRKVGIILIILAIITPVLPLEMSASKQAITLVVGLIIWLLGIYSGRNSSL